MFLDCAAAFSECRFSIPAPVSHRSVAKLRRHKLRITRFHVGTKSSFAPLLLLSPKSHTTFWGPHCSSLSHIPFGRSFSFQFAPQLVVSEKDRKLTPSASFFELCLQRQKEPVHSTSNQREIISRYIFDETMYRLWYSETFNACFFRSAGRRCNRSGAAAISFGGCLVFHFRYSVVGSAIGAEYSIAYRTLVRQLNFRYLRVYDIF